MIQPNKAANQEPPSLAKPKVKNTFYTPKNQQNSYERGSYRDYNQSYAEFDLGGGSSPQKQKWIFDFEEEHRKTVLKEKVSQLICDELLTEVVQYDVMESLRDAFIELSQRKQASQQRHNFSPESDHKHGGGNPSLHYIWVHNGQRSVKVRPLRQTEDELSSIHQNDSRDAVPVDTWTDLLQSEVKHKRQYIKEQCDISESSNESNGSSGIEEGVIGVMKFTGAKKVTKVEAPHNSQINSLHEVYRRNSDYYLINQAPITPTKRFRKYQGLQSPEVCDFDSSIGVSPQQRTYQQLPNTRQPMNSPMGINVGGLMTSLGNSIQQSVRKLVEKSSEHIKVFKQTKQSAVSQKEVVIPTKATNYDDEIIEIPGSQEIEPKRDSNHNHTQSDMFDEVVDVKCNQCHALIPFGDVNSHSLKCFKNPSLNQNDFKNIEEQFEAQIRDINEQAAKIQEAIKNRVFKLEEQLANNLEEAIKPRGDLKSRVSKLHSAKNVQNTSLLDDQSIEFFLEQFSNLYAICDAIIENDDDEEQLQALLKILEEDFFTNSNPIKIQHKERHQQQMVFARRLNFLIMYKLRVFDDYIQCHQMLQEQDFFIDQRQRGEESPQTEEKEVAQISESNQLSKSEKKSFKMTFRGRNWELGEETPQLAINGSSRSNSKRLQMKSTTNVNQMPQITFENNQTTEHNNTLSPQKPKKYSEMVLNEEKTEKNMLSHSEKDEELVLTSDPEKPNGSAKLAIEFAKASFRNMSQRGYRQNQHLFKNQLRSPRTPVTNDQKSNSHQRRNKTPNMLRPLGGSVLERTFISAHNHLGSSLQFQLKNFEAKMKRSQNELNKLGSSRGISQISMHNNFIDDLQYQLFQITSNGEENDSSIEMITNRHQDNLLMNATISDNVEVKVISVSSSSSFYDQLLADHRYNRVLMLKVAFFEVVLASISRNREILSTYQEINNFKVLQNTYEKLRLNARHCKIMRKVGMLKQERVLGACFAKIKTIWRRAKELRLEIEQYQMKKEKEIQKKCLSGLIQFKHMSHKKDTLVTGRIIFRRQVVYFKQWSALTKHQLAEKALQKAIEQQEIQERQREQAENKQAFDIATQRVSFSILLRAVNFQIRDLATEVVSELTYKRKVAEIITSSMSAELVEMVVADEAVLIANKCWHTEIKAKEFEHRKALFQEQKRQQKAREAEIKLEQERADQRATVISQLINELLSNSIKIGEQRIQEELIAKQKLETTRLEQIKLEEQRRRDELALFETTSEAVSVRMVLAVADACCHEVALDLLQNEIKLHLFEQLPEDVFDQLLSRLIASTAKYQIENFKKRERYQALKEKQLQNHKLRLQSLNNIEDLESKEAAFKKERERNGKTIEKLLHVYQDVLDDDDKHQLTSEISETERDHTNLMEELGQLQYNQTLKFTDTDMLQAREPLFNGQEESRNQLNRFDTPQFMAGELSSNSQAISLKNLVNIHDYQETKIDQNPEVFQFENSQTSIFENFEIRDDQFDPTQIEANNPFNDFEVPDFQQTYRSQELDIDQDFRQVQLVDQLTTQPLPTQFDIFHFQTATSQICSDIIDTFIKSQLKTLATKTLREEKANKQNTMSSIKQKLFLREIAEIVADEMVDEFVITQVRLTAQKTAREQAKKCQDSLIKANKMVLTAADQLINQTLRDLITETLIESKQDQIKSQVKQQIQEIYSEATENAIKLEETLIELKLKTQENQVNLGAALDEVWEGFIDDELCLTVLDVYDIEVENYIVQQKAFEIITNVVKKEVQSISYKLLKAKSRVEQAKQAVKQRKQDLDVSFSSNKYLLASDQIIHEVEEEKEEEAVYDLRSSKPKQLNSRSVTPKRNLFSAKNKAALGVNNETADGSYQTSDSGKRKNFLPNQKKPEELKKKMQKSLMNEIFQQSKNERKSHEASQAKDLNPISHYIEATNIKKQTKRTTVDSSSGSQEKATGSFRQFREDKKKQADQN